MDSPNKILGEQEKFKRVDKLMHNSPKRKEERKTNRSTHNPMRSRRRFGKTAGDSMSQSHPLEDSCVTQEWVSLRIPVLITH
jgi:hypothetical protein